MNDTKHALSMATMLPSFSTAAFNVEGNTKFRSKNFIQLLRDLRDLRGEEVFCRMLNVAGGFAQAAKNFKDSCTEITVGQLRGR